jgi:catechol 2,3-dioxygenase-like lactoylglutathione lyase family enzyme
MTTIAMKPRVTSFAPQFLVDDLERSIRYYERLGFTFGEPWERFYAIGHLDGLELHLEEAPKNQDERRYRRDNEHLDAAAGVDGIEAFFRQCVVNGAMILKPLAPTAWGTKDFYAITIIQPTRGLGVAVFANAGGERAKVATTDTVKVLIRRFASVGEK